MPAVRAERDALPGALSSAVEAASPDQPPAEQAAETFDGRARRASLAVAAAVVAATVSPALAPPAYALAHGALGRAKPSRKPTREELRQVAEAHIALPSAFAVGLLSTFLAPTHESFLLAAIVTSLLAAPAMENYLAVFRKRVIGGWQASHDQRYRVDNATGRLKDVRGHKIGEDRYEAYALGAVGPWERTWIRLVSSGAGLVWISSAGAPQLYVYAAAVTGGFFVADLLRRRRSAPPMTAEDAAHAARFGIKR